MPRYLLIDFGSTYTKLTAVGSDQGDILATAAHPTTVASDISIGYLAALERLYERLGERAVFDETIACSSAAGGLKMAAIGLVEELTVEAARRVCLGAGAKVDLVFSHHMTKREVASLVENKIDIVLLAGGADGGNTENVLFNLRMLGEAGIRIPIIYAGNKSCQDDVQDLFDRYQLDGRITENVMPKINQLNIGPAREAIRKLFLEKIIEAKGIKKIESQIDKVILPTPEAVLRAAELLSLGTLDEKGLGELVMVDIGGATTDFYSLSHPTRRGDVVLHGLEEPYAKRTVEGDLGMRWSATGVLKAMTMDEIRVFSDRIGVDLKEAFRHRHDHVDFLPESETDHLVDALLARICLEKAITRHAGKMEEVYTPLGNVLNQTGKDLSHIEWVIGTGGPVIKSKDPLAILKHAAKRAELPFELRPVAPRYLLDKDYIMAAMGLLSQKDPLLALRIMKKRLIRLEPDEVHYGRT